LAGLLLPAAARAQQQARGYYTDARLAALRRNVAESEWARVERDRILARAAKWLVYSDERLRTLVPPPGVPRAGIAHLKGAPVNGEALNKHGRTSWIISFDDPWKITSPVDGAVYPSNDFAAFMKSGYKDRSLLTGPYPDDGWGCEVPDENKRFWFVGVYAKLSAERLLIPALADLSRAYLITDDSRYAHACALLLWQLAEYYPRYAYEKQSRYGAEFDVSYLGRLLYHTYEALFTAQTVPPAYDAVRPAIEHDQALQAFTGQSAAEICAHIESRILRTMATDIMDGSGRIQGNYGMHQVALLRIATVLRGSAETPGSDEMVAWVLRNPHPRNYTQLGLIDALSNLLHRDGFPFESPSYNCHWITEISEIVEDLDADGRSAILEMPRFRKLYTWPLRMACVGEFVPSYGDSNHLFHGLLGWGPYAPEPGYRFFGNPGFARALVQSKGKLKRDLFRASVEKEMAEAAVRHPAPVGVASQLLSGVGFASLQTGGDGNRTAVAVFYGFYHGHAHHDRLQLDIYSRRNALTPDFGYPETADAWDPRRFGFLSHTVAHNTVMINARRQEAQRGRLHVYDPGSFAQLVEVSAEACYPDTAKLYRRTLILVDASPDHAYVVDIFRVRGGTQHDWLVHGTQAEFTSDLGLTEPRQRGTLAGPDVAYGRFYDDERYADDNKANVPFYKYKGSAFQWLFNVQQAALDGYGRVSWHLNRPEKLWPDPPREGVVLRAHLIGRDEAVFACDGVPQRRPTWPETVKFVVRRRVGDALESTFVTVFEPYRHTSFIESVKALPVTDAGDMPVALEIGLIGKTHVVFNRLESPESERSVLGLSGGRVIDARAAVLEKLADAEFSQAYVLDNEASRGLPATLPPRSSARRRVKTVDYDKGIIHLTESLDLTAAPAGGIALVTSPNHANAVPFRTDAAAPTTCFRVGDDDLTAGKVYVTDIAERCITFTPAFNYFLEPGMSVVNLAGVCVGRIRTVRLGRMTLDRDGITLEDFPTETPDGRRPCRIAVVGRGDRITLHFSTRVASAAQ
jgi:oligo-alginate lyase